MTAAETTPSSKRLRRCPREIENLPAPDRQAALKIHDGLVARQEPQVQGARR